MADLEKIVEDLSVLTVIEAADLAKLLEEKWGVSAAAPVAMAMAAPADGGAAAEEQTEFDVILASYGEKKINVIKEVRALTGLGLKEAKDLVESAPKEIKEGIDKEEAEKIKEKLDTARGELEIAQRNGDLARAGELAYGVIPDFERELAELETGEAARMLDEAVGESHIASVVARWSGIPVEKMLEGEREKLLQMENSLRRRLIGQDEAVIAISNAVRKETNVPVVVTPSITRLAP